MSGPANPGTREIGKLQFENIAISVSDIDRSAAWYGNILGFSTIREGTFYDGSVRFAFLEGKGMRIELISSGRAPVPDNLPQPPAHLDTAGFKALVLRTDDLSAVTRELEGLGVPMVWKEQTLTDDLSATLIRDPDGNFTNIIGPAPGQL